MTRGGTLLVKSQYFFPKFWEFPPHEMKKILCEMRFNPREMRLMPINHLCEILHSMIFNISTEIQLHFQKSH